MNKEQAAKRLGVDVRTLQRYMSAHRISFTLRNTKTGQVADFSKAEVDRFKRELKEKRLTATVTPALAPVSEPVSLMLPRDLNEPQALTRMQHAQLLLLNEISNRLSKPTQQTTADRAGKLAITFKEAVQLSGFPPSQIKRAIASKELKAIKTGRGWRIKCDDLDAYVRKL